MKLFKSLLVAPATLGLLAPMSVTANELNIADVSSYSSSEEVQNISEFSPELAITNSRVDGLEARLNDFEAGSFSDTTTASFGTTFYVGSIDEGADNGATTFTYDFALDLETSFTGEDSLEVAIIGGTAGTTAVDGVMGGDMATLTNTSTIDTVPADIEIGTPDYLVLDGISYTFPLGGFTVAVGDGVGVDELNTGACVYSAFTDTVSDCGTGSLGGEADSAVAASYDFGNGFTAAAGIGFGTETDGILSDEDSSTIGLEVAYTADTYALSFAYTEDDETAGDQSYYSIQAAFTPDAAYSISAGFEFDDDDADSVFVGLTTEAGPGSISVGASTQSLEVDQDNNYMYELSYSYPVNDGMTITPGAFIVEDAEEDEFGMVVTTSFSF